MRPSYDSDDYTAGKKGRKPITADTPWGLLIVLLFSSSCALYTRHRSMSNGDASGQTATRSLLEEGTLDDVHLDNPLEPTAPTYREDIPIQKLAEAAFNPMHHELYADLPPLQRLTEEQEKGGWKFTDAVYDYAARHPGATVANWEKPRVVVFKSFLTPEEVGHIIAVAKDNLVRSHVLSTTEDDVVDSARTSFGAWPPHDEILDAVNERIHRIVGIPKSFGEDLYVLNYKLGQKYDAHNDNCVDLIEGKIPSQLDESCIGFLKRSGGPDCGPGAGGDSCETEKEGGDEDDVSYCHEDTLGVNPGPGDATLFWDYVPGSNVPRGSYTNGTAEPAGIPVKEALHSGCPVLEGEKWIATRWIRAAKFV
ncbi:hypothetical protein Ndes2437A_g06099 [Nannochloris sp. 'desiccata']